MGNPWLSARARANPLSDLLSGLGLLITGAGLVLRRARLFGLGLIPPLITSVLFVALFATASFLSQRIAVWLTPFADGWPGVEALRALVSLLVIAISGLLLVLLFTATTLALGAPLYDRISEEVDAHAGNYNAAPSESWLHALWSTLTLLLKVVAITLPVGLLFLLVGLIPVIGGVLAAIGSALFGGWMVTLEMIGSPAGRRGIRTLAQRQRLLCRDPWLVLGFGVPTFLLLSIPALSLLLFPIATAAGTLLTRRLVAR
ncbi:MAG: EI24 domain-containing protein [Micropruina sp.]|uniref:EI24 domain-containing protein n=1 Tax=Micropruina sp. TaxID=2737536 RepID=UPI0039E43F80